MPLSSPVRQNLWTRSVAAAILSQMDAYRREVGARLRRLRKAKNWSQEDAAHAVGVTSATWGRWERGRTSPYEHNWQKIEETFGIDSAEIRGVPPAPLGFGTNGQPSQLDRIEGKLDVVLAALVPSTKQRADQLAQALLAAGRR